MKKQFGKLSKAEREEIEASYHEKSPQEFDELMSRASAHHPIPKSRVKSARKLSKTSPAPKPPASK